MAKLVVIYGKPDDAAAFERHYANTHVPIARTIPGLRDLEVSRGPIMSPAGPAEAHLVATLTFDDMQALQAALASPEGRAAAGDLQNFATGGVQVLMFETSSI